MTDIQKAFGRPKHEFQVVPPHPDDARPKRRFWPVALAVVFGVGALSVVGNMEKLADSGAKGGVFQFALRGPSDEEVIEKLKAALRTEMIPILRASGPIILMMVGESTAEGAADKILRTGGYYIEDKALSGDTFVADVVMKSGLPIGEDETRRVTMKRGANGWYVVGQRRLE